MASVDLAKARVLAALKKAGLTVAGARGLSEKDLLAIKGIGKAALGIIKGEENVSRETDAMPPPLQSLPYSIQDDANRMLHLLAEKQTVTPAVVQEAWRLAQLHAEYAKSGGGPVPVHDGMVVEYGGQTMILRTKMKPNEALPPSARKAILVPFDAE
jgi:hypothetical protein